MTTKTFEKIGDLFQCKLILESGVEFTIPLREDGYIYATGLCQAVGKRMHDWLRTRETKNFIKELEKRLSVSGLSDRGNIPVSGLIQVYKGGNNKYNQGTWIHPDLGLNLAQWCSPSFSLQVSKWLRELIFTGGVEIGKEKNEEEIKKSYEKIIQELKETKEKLNNAETLLIKYDENNKQLSKKYNKINLNHQFYLRRKELYKLKQGNCIYLIDMKLKYDDEDIQRIKVGITSSITNRVSGYRTSNPFCYVLMVMYVEDSDIVERNMKKMYNKQLFPNNSEFITDVSFEELKESMISLAKMLNLEYTLETDEEIEKFNKHIILENKIEDINDDKIYDGKKRCGGLHHTDEESRMVDLNNFFKNKNNKKDGYARLCKNCYLIGVYGDQRKQRKVIDLPEFDTTTHKWCNLCECVKEHKDFYCDKMKKDGLNANCKSCKNLQKISYLQKKKEEQKVNGEYQKEKKKAVMIPEFDKTTHKWCAYCENVKEHQDFSVDKNRKDGFQSYCKSCKKTYKNNWSVNYKAKIQTMTVENTKEHNELLKFSKDELLAMAKERELILRVTYTKDELIEIIKANKKVNMLETKTRTELRSLAIERGLKVNYKNTKEELIELLSSTAV